MERELKGHRGGDMERKGRGERGGSEWVEGGGKLPRLEQGAIAGAPTGPCPHVLVFA